MQIQTQAEPPAEPVVVAIPARAEYVSVARLTAAAVAARQGFPYDVIEDLKIAVSEACSALIAAGKSPRPQITLHFVPDRDALTIRIATQSIEADANVHGATRPLDMSTIGIFLMQCLVDEVDIRHTDGRNTLTLRLAKPRQEGSDAGSAPAEQN